jgi:hypothetical protein
LLRPGPATGPGRPAGPGRVLKHWQIFYKPCLDQSIQSDKCSINCLLSTSGMESILWLKTKLNMLICWNQDKNATQIIPREFHKLSTSTGFSLKNSSLTWIWRGYDGWVPREKSNAAQRQETRSTRCTAFDYWFVSTDAETLFKDSLALSRSESEWAADTNNLIPTGKRHLSMVDLFEVTKNTESSFNAWKIHNYKETE